MLNNNDMCIQQDMCIYNALACILYMTVGSYLTMTAFRGEIMSDRVKTPNQIDIPDTSIIIISDKSAAHGSYNMYYVNIVYLQVC